MTPLPHKLWADVMTGVAFFTGQPLPRRPRQVHYEAKAGAGSRTAHQMRVDNWVNQNLGNVSHLGIEEVRALRAFPDQIPIKFVIQDMDVRFKSMIRAKILDGDTADSLLHNMKLCLQSGVVNVPVIDYVGLFDEARRDRRAQRR